MNLKRDMAQTMLGIAALALSVTLAQGAFAEPPAHAPAHGYRNKKGAPPPKSSNAKLRLPQRTANDIDGDGIPNSRDRDMDGDGLANNRDKDMDGDGIPNSRDRQPQVANARQKPLPKDAHDSKGAFWDRLKKGDNHRDGKDGKESAKQKARHGDIDKDGIANRKDKDLDGDGIRNKKDKDRDGDHVANKKDDFDRRKNRK